MYLIILSGIYEDINNGRIGSADLKELQVLYETLRVEMIQIDIKIQNTNEEIKVLIEGKKNEGDAKFDF
jgi:hypothetical protein